ncbi:MAG: DVUA0089 family protein [Candidatus Sedimenticola sp. (ex Thyasira tokunagai)]
MKIKKNLLTALGLITFSGMAQAAYINEIDNVVGPNNNNTPATAQDLSSSFSSNPGTDPTLEWRGAGTSTFFVSVKGYLNSDHDPADYYRVDITHEMIGTGGLTAAFDTDGTQQGFQLDTELSLYNSEQLVLAENNDDPGGSPLWGDADTPTTNSFMTYTFNAPGTYFLAVFPFMDPDSFAGSVSGNYTLNISTDMSPLPSPVPVPAAAWLFGSGLLGLAGLRRIKKSKGSAPG